MATFKWFKCHTRWLQVAPQFRQDAHAQFWTDFLSLILLRTIWTNVRKIHGQLALNQQQRWCGESDNRHINDETSSMVTEGNVARAKQICDDPDINADIYQVWLGSHLSAFGFAFSVPCIVVTSRSRFHFLMCLDNYYSFFSSGNCRPRFPPTTTTTSKRSMHRRFN